MKPVPAKEKVSAALSLAMPGAWLPASLDSSLLYGIEMLCDNKRAFVNCTREVLFKDLITLLPPSQTVAEILETVEPEDRIIAACKSSRSAMPWLFWESGKCGVGSGSSSP